MRELRRWLETLVALALVSQASQAACVHTPCPAAAAASASGQPEAVSSAAPAARGRLVIWDGDKIGAAGQGWADCDKKPDCKTVVAKASGAGANKSDGLKWHGEGPGWAGMGWNWFGWWPETAGTDITPYANLTFQIRVEGKAHDAGLDPAALTTLLRCSKNKKESARVAIQKYTADFADGQWHEVIIPIADLVKSNEGGGFDPKTAWEFDLANWSATPRDFDIYVDDIAVEN
jgi:hypothetical protein